MKAVLMTAYGDVDVLQLREVPDPTAAAGQIVVRMAGASINPIDWKLRSGAYQAYVKLELPHLPGRDASGFVVAVGPGVKDFKVGTRVLGRNAGTYAELVVGPADGWAELPAKLDLVDAGALPLVLLTGAQLVEEAIKARVGQTILVTGALGSVGRVAVFTAKASGARVYAGVRAAQRQEASKLGADAVVALDDDGDVDKLPPLDALADTVGGAITERLLPKVKAGGVVGSVVGEPAGAKARGLAVHAIMTHSDSRRLAALANDVAEGKLVIPIAKRFLLAQAAEAQKLAEAGAKGKVLLIGNL